MDDNEGWIKCSDRMPEEHAFGSTKGWMRSDKVEITLYNAVKERNEVDMDFTDNGKWSWHWGSKIIAWRPLPEPYKGA